VGTLDVYVTQPRAWTAAEVEALGALAVVTTELVSTGVELAVRDAEVTQLRQALASRVWIEQAKGVLAATEGVSPDAAFQQLRKQARSSSRKLADLAQEVVQAAQIGLARRAAALDRAQDDADARERAADQRNHLADQRDLAADERDRAADERDRTARDTE
ncbi:MAG TPA: ANTAR domain-containing protein, partial [Actinomycetes bacterium]